MNVEQNAIKSEAPSAADTAVPVSAEAEHYETESIELDPGFYTTKVEAVKSVDGDTYRVGGYAVVFTNPSAKDVTEEYFTAESVSPLYPNPVVLYHHGLDKNLKATVIGQVTKLEKDDIGWWAEAQLDKRNRYSKTLMEMVKAGKLGWSSGALPQAVERARDGRLNDWRIIEISLTPTPAMPEVTTVVAKSWHTANVDLTAKAYKAIGVSPDFLSEYLRESGQPVAKDKPEVTAEAERPAEPAVKAVAEVAPAIPETQIDKPISQENKTMTDAPVAVAPVAPVITQEQLNAAIKSASESAAAAAVQAALAQIPAKSLPASNPPAVKAADNAATTYQVIGDRRFADLSAMDMSYMIDVFGALTKNVQVSGRSGSEVARGILGEFIGSEDKRLQRELSAKCIREVSRNALSDSVIASLPYKTMADVEGNNYKSVAFKANELDNTSLSNQGVDWVPTIWSNELWKRVRISNPVAGNIGVVQMPALTYNLPIQSTDPTVYYTGEAASGTDLAFYGAQIAVTQYKTNKISLTAKKLSARPAMSTEFTEDSIIPAIEDAREQTMRAMQNAIDDTILNGDVVTSASTNINLIDGTPAVAPNMPSYLAFDGMRKYALVTNTAQSVSFGGVGPTLALLRQMQATLAPQYAVDLANLMLVVDPYTYQRLKGMPEFATAQNVGGPGSNMLGVLPGGSSNTVAQQAYPVGVIDGYPVYVSAQLGKSQSTGKISGTPANNTLGTAVLYHKSRWKLGYRRSIQMDTLYSPFLSDTVQIIVTARIALGSFDTQAAAVGYNIAV